MDGLNNRVSSLRRRSCSFMADRLREHFLNAQATQQQRRAIGRDSTSDRLTDLLQAALTPAVTPGEQMRRSSREALLPPILTSAMASTPADVPAPATTASLRQNSFSGLVEDHPLMTHVVDISDPTNAPQGQPPMSNAGQNPADPATATAANAATRTAQAISDNQSIANQLQQLFSSMQGVLPFVAIASSKLLFDHRLG